MKNRLHAILRAVLWCMNFALSIFFVACISARWGIMNKAVVLSVVAHNSVLSGIIAVGVTILVLLVVRFIFKIPEPPNKFSLVWFGFVLSITTYDVYLYILLSGQIQAIPWMSFVLDASYAIMAILVVYSMRREFKKSWRPKD